MFGFEAVVIELVFKLTVALFAMVGVRFGLMWFDKIIGVHPFSEWINDADDMPKAVYYGLRFVAVCLLVGLALS